MGKDANRNWLARGISIQEEVVKLETESYTPAAMKLLFV
jgi:hypothetical protein